MIPVSEIRKFPNKTGAKAEETEIERIEKSSNVINTEDKRKHFALLVEIAKRPLSNDLDSVKCISDDTYEYVSRRYYPPLLSPETISKEELTEILKSNFEYASQLYQRMDTFDYFKQHLEAENPQIKDIEQYVETSAFELIKLLKLLVLKREFKGKCPACEG